MATDREDSLEESLSGIEPEKLSAAELLREVAARAIALARKEIQLARAEVRSNLHAELAALKGVAIAAVLAVTALNLALVAAVFGLARLIPDWAAALCTALAVLLAAGISAAVAWHVRVRTPLARTRKTLEEDLEWTREQLS